jgi:hypothetical protein
MKEQKQSPFRDHFPVPPKLLLFQASGACAALQHRDSLTVDVQWDGVQIECKTMETLQSVANPPLLPDSSTQASAFDFLRLVAADYARYVPWFPYLKMSVPEIHVPVMNETYCSTSWDFTYADQLLLDFLANTPNVSHIINFSTTLEV